MIQSNLTDKALRHALTDVWARLPDYARQRLEALGAVVEQVDDPDDLVIIKGRLATVVYRTRRPLGDMEIIIYIRSGLEPSPARWALAHEFAHLANGHYLQTAMRIPKRDAEAAMLKTWFDDMADYTAAVEWGFVEDLRPFAEARHADKPYPRWWPMFAEVTNVAG